MINLDHAATTAPDEAVIRAVEAAMREAPANPSALYAAAGAGRRILRDTRAAVAEALNAREDEVYFTSGGAEADTWAVRQAAGRRVALAATEHIHA